jgi:predicted nucleic acid binding AN1-type Zn finger protein
VLSWPQTVIKKELNWWFLKIFIFAYIIILCTTCQVQKRTFQSSLGLEASFVCESVYFNFESSRKKQEFPTNQLLPQIIKGFEKKITLNYI